jgi:hypothetical protein
MGKLMGFIGFYIEMTVITFWRKLTGLSLVAFECEVLWECRYQFNGGGDMLHVAIGE